MRGQNLLYYKNATLLKNALSFFVQSSDTVILCEIYFEQRHKESKLRYFTLSLIDYILCQICFEQRHKESKLRYLTLSLDDYILCEICFEQRHNESKLSLNDYVVFEMRNEQRIVNCNLQNQNISQYI